MRSHDTYKKVDAINNKKKQKKRYGLLRESLDLQ